MKRALKSPANQYVIIIIIFLSLFFCSPTIQFNGGLLMCFDCQVLLIQLSSSLLPAKVLTALWHCMTISAYPIDWHPPVFAIEKPFGVSSTHYSKSQIFVQKFNFDKSPTFSRVFTQFFFLKCFSWNQSCQPLKSPKPQHFHEFFILQKSNFFSVNQSWIFGQKMKISNSVLYKVK